MKKVVGLKSLGLLCFTFLFFLVIVVVIVDAQGVNSQFKTQGKPVKPPGQDNPEEITWGAQILDYGGNLFGKEADYIYKSSDPFVNVTVQEGKKTGNTTIHFFLYANYDPPDPWIQFRDVVMTDFVFGEEGPNGACGFPYPYNSLGTPGCLGDFFNSQHPKLGYEHILFYIVLADADLEDLSMFPEGVEILWTGSGVVKIYIWNSFDPLTAEDPEPYNSVTAHLKTYCMEDGKGIWIRRVADTWEIRIEQQVFDISEHYSWEEPATTTKGKPTSNVTYYTPLEAKTTLSYIIRLIKNPS